MLEVNFVKYTPMIEQYLQVKAQAQDAFLFFRLGDFYELFFDDAILAARELEITLTGREGGAEERIPMCGVPYHAADNYVARLIEKGYKVAICEQVEDPATAKGVVKREIVRVITPGTVMDEKVTGRIGNNFIVSIAEHSNGYGFATCDLSTGELYVSPYALQYKQLIDELNVFEPTEIVGQIQKLLQFEQYLHANRQIVFTAWEPNFNEDLEVDLGRKGRLWHSASHLAVTAKPLPV